MVPRILVVSILCSLLLVPAVSALTTEEILHLKNNGVSEATIQLIIQYEMEEKGRTESGPHIKDGESSITYSTGRSEKRTFTEEEIRNRERAWELLNNLRLHYISTPAD